MWGWNAFALCASAREWMEEGAKRRERERAMKKEKWWEEVVLVVERTGMHVMVEQIQVSSSERRGEGLG